MASSFTRFLYRTQQRNTVSRTPLDKWSARRRDIYLTTHNNHNRQTSMPPAGFEPIIITDERPQTYVLDAATTRTAKTLITLVFSTFYSVLHLQLFYQCLPLVLLPTYSVLWAERRFSHVMVDDIFSLESFYFRHYRVCILCHNVNGVATVFASGVYSHWR
jgi:hypothetical protein